MKNKTIKTIAYVIASLTLTACVTDTYKTWQTLDGSKSDGTITLGYSFTSAENVILRNDGTSTAKSSCKSWGYNSAKAFSLQEQTCTGGYYLYGSWICTSADVIRKYQCINASTSSTLSAEDFPLNEDS